MRTLALIGLIAGLVTGISRRISPVLPIISFTGTRGARENTESANPQLERADDDAGGSRMALTNWL